MEITGRLVASAAVKEVKGDRKVTEFTIAINDSYRPKGGERVDITTYIECAYWLNAGLARYLKKGALVTVSGRIGVNAWLNQQGEPKATLTFHTSDIKLLGRAAKSRTGRQDDETVQEDTVYHDVNPDDDDLPF